MVSNKIPPEKTYQKVANFIKTKSNNCSFEHFDKFLILFEDQRSAAITIIYKYIISMRKQNDENEVDIEFLKGLINRWRIKTFDNEVIRWSPFDAVIWNKQNLDNNSKLKILRYLIQKLRKETYLIIWKEYICLD